MEERATADTDVTFELSIRERLKDFRTGLIFSALAASCS